jgi:Undecaprenyl-phosphate glucose phosphotransferase
VPRRPLAARFRFGAPEAQRRRAFVRGGFALVAALADLCAVILGATIVGHALGFVTAVPTRVASALVNGGGFLGVLFIVIAFVREDYDIVRYLALRPHARRVLFQWNVVFIVLLLAAFVIGSADRFPPAAVAMLYGVGYGVLVIARFAMCSYVARDSALREAASRRVFLVGSEEEIERFVERHDRSGDGARIVAAAVLRGPDTIADDLALAAASARMLRPDNVFILMPWTRSEAIEACVTAFTRVPAAIHLGPERVLERFPGARVSRIGATTSLSLVRQPLTPLEVMGKRCLDIVLAAILIVALLPLFAIVAIAIKLDSPGPVLFLQRRYGFNQEPFRIVKFRSMTALEDGRGVRQAVKGDTRVTAVGRLIRRYNIDELPQLLNVLRGEMSLVGPRPHALAHDQRFERIVADYARRHNVKPGITGWAQVNGLRGPVLTPDAVRRRVEHDLYYIDNWSMALDLRILLLTLLSAKAFENAV